MTKEQLEVFHNSYEVNNKGCWLWIRTRLDNSGYAHFTKTGLAHRVSYEHFKGQIPKGLELDHICEQRNCCNPDHLEPVTHKVNCSRGKVNQHKAKTHCKNGHPLSGENLYLFKTPRGTQGRACRVCRYELVKQHRARQKEMTTK